jgi:ABC-type transporter Mla subunit MlaD
MNQKLSIHSVVFRVAVVAVMALLHGCASSGPNAKDTVDSMSAFGNETAKAKDTINKTVKSLETLTSSQAADIKNNFDAYSNAVTALDGQAKLVKANADKMQANGDLFFKDWEGSETVTPERRAELSASYARIKTDMAAARENFVPFMASLKDIQSYLSLDPTLKGINSMGGLAQKARDNSVTVNSQLDAVLTDLNSVRGMLSTKPK